MAHYLVTAKPIDERLGALRARLDAGEIKTLEPFGRTLHRSLSDARVGNDGRALWEEEDYCSPPLAQERAAVLDEHFQELRVEPVRKGEGWRRIEKLPRMWITESNTGGAVTPASKRDNRT